jgi:hypothetical protein
LPSYGFALHSVLQWQLGQLNHVHCYTSRFVARQQRRSPLVVTQHTIYQTADIGNAETWAAVAMVAIASVIDRSSAPVVATSVSGAMTAQL